MTHRPAHIDQLRRSSIALFACAVLVVCGCGDKSTANLQVDSDKSKTPKADSVPEQEVSSTPLRTNDNWPLFRGDPQATGIVDGQLPEKPELLWKFTSAGENPGIEATAAIADGTVFIANMDRGVEAIDLETGKRKWICNTETGFFASPAVKDGRVFVGDLDGIFYAIDAKNGEILWKFQTQAEINSSANFYKDVVLFGSQDGAMYALDMKSGDQRWKYEINDQVWCLPTIAVDKVFLAGCDAKLHVIDIETGKSSGGVELGNPTNCTPAAHGDFVYVGTQGGTFFGIDWKNQKVAWTYMNEKRQLPYQSSAAVTDELVIVGGRDKIVKALSRNDGKEAWTYSAKARVDSSPVVVEDRVFFGTDGGRLVALDLATGKEVWQYEAGGAFVASPAVAAGRLIIGNTDGTLYCFGEKAK